jgi:hypothetical protein
MPGLLPVCETSHLGFSGQGMMEVITAHTKKGSGHERDAVT